MQKFTRWLTAVIRHFLLLIGGTIAGVIGVWVQQYAKGGVLAWAPFYGLCAFAFVVALFVAWRDENDRAESAEVASKRLCEDCRSAESFL